jgi:hypothetical protein
MSDLETLEQDELLAALGEAVTTTTDVESASFRDLIDAAGRELKRRFDDDPESLPGTFVIKLFLDGQKAIASKDVPDDVPEVSILDRIDALPTEHAVALIRGELARLNSLLTVYADALLRLEGNN